VHNQALLGPPDVQWLVRLEVLVAVQRLLLEALHQRGIHVQRGDLHRHAALDCRHEVAVDLAKPTQMLVGPRDECLARLAPLLLARVMEPLQVAKDGRRRRHRPGALLPLATIDRTPFPPRQPGKLDPPHDPAEAVVRLQHAQVIDTVAASDVHADQRHDNLAVRPTLTSPTHRQVRTHRVAQPQYVRHVPPDR
jgi:hypothetical protein